MSAATAAGSVTGEAALLREFGIDASALLGAGGEARVFALDDERVLRVWHRAPSDSMVDDMLASWSPQLRCGDRTIEVTSVLDRGTSGSLAWRIDRRLSGVPMTRWLRATPDADARHRALLTGLDVASALHTLALPSGFDRPWSRPLAPGQPVYDSLPALLDAGMVTPASSTWASLAERVPDLAAERRRVLEQVSDRDVAPRFVHADVFPGNLMVDADGTVTGVLDVSVHAMVADPVLDAVGMVCLLDFYPAASQDSAWLGAVLAEQLGDDGWLVASYRRWYAFYYAMETALVDWAARQFAA